MRKRWLLAAPLILAGCSQVPWARQGSATQGLRVASANPTAADLVSAVNENARRVQTLECRNVSLDCSQGRESVGLLGLLACQPAARNFRMTAKALGSTEVDLGSNSQEFWFWVKRAPQPYLYHCSHQDFASGQAQMPFPFQPDWIVEALGVAEYNPAKSYRVQTYAGGFDLMEDSTSPQGAPVRKITRFSRSQGQLLVSAHVLQDSAGQEICAAVVRRFQQDRASGAVLPQEVVLSWPAQQIRMRMVLDRALVNNAVDAQRQALLFSRPSLRDVPTYDLARGPDGGSPVRRMGGTYR